MAPPSRVRQAVNARLMRWAARHGADHLPLTVNRRRIYIIPTRFGAALGLLLAAMLLAGLNYNSNLGLAFGFLLLSLVLVAMHHCHRNLLGLRVDVGTAVDAVAGAHARFDFQLQNTSAIERCDIDIRCGGQSAAAPSIPAAGYLRTAVDIPTPRRGILRHDQFELRTRYPFGWFRAWTYVQSPLTAFVAPEPRGSHAMPRATSTAGTAAQSELRGDEDFSGLRAYEAGIPLKHMAWKVLARGGEPAVRSYTGHASRPEWLDWWSLTGLDTEARLSQLCRWVLESEAGRHPYGLRLPGIDIAPECGTSQRSRCLRALAGYAGDHGGGDHRNGSDPHPNPNRDPDSNRNRGTA